MLQNPAQLFLETKAKGWLEVKIGRNRRNFCCVRVRCRSVRYQTAVAAIEQYGWQAIHGDAED